MLTEMKVPMHIVLAWLQLIWHAPYGAEIDSSVLTTDSDSNPYFRPITCNQENDCGLNAHCLHGYCVCWNGIMEIKDHEHSSSDEHCVNSRSTRTHHQYSYTCNVTQHCMDKGFSTDTECERGFCIQPCQDSRDCTEPEITACFNYFCLCESFSSVYHLKKSVSCTQPETLEKAKTTAWDYWWTYLIITICSALLIGAVVSAAVYWHKQRDIEVEVLLTQIQRATKERASVSEQNTALPLHPDIKRGSLTNPDSQCAMVCEIRVATPSKLSANLKKMSKMSSGTNQSQVTDRDDFGLIDLNFLQETDDLNNKNEQISE